MENTSAPQHQRPFGPLDTDFSEMSTEADGPPSPRSPLPVFSGVQGEGKPLEATSLAGFNSNPAEKRQPTLEGVLGTQGRGRAEGKDLTSQGSTASKRVEFKDNGSVIEHGDDSMRGSFEVPAWQHMRRGGDSSEQHSASIQGNTPNSCLAKPSRASFNHKKTRSLTTTDVATQVMIPVDASGQMDLMRLVQDETEDELEEAQQMLKEVSRERDQFRAKWEMAAQALQATARNDKILEERSFVQQRRILQLQKELRSEKRLREDHAAVEKVMERVAMMEHRLMENTRLQVRESHNVLSSALLSSLPELGIEDASMADSGNNGTPAFVATGSPLDTKQLDFLVRSAVDELRDLRAHQPIDHPDVYVGHYKLALAVAKATRQDTANMQTVLNVVIEKASAAAAELKEDEVPEAGQVKATFSNARKASPLSIFTKLAALAEDDGQQEVMELLSFWSKRLSEVSADGAYESLRNREMVPPSTLPSAIHQRMSSAGMLSQPTSPLHVAKKGDSTRPFATSTSSKPLNGAAGPMSKTLSTGHLNAGRHSKNLSPGPLTKVQSVPAHLDPTAPHLAPNASNFPSGSAATTNSSSSVASGGGAVNVRGMIQGLMETTQGVTSEMNHMRLERQSDQHETLNMLKLMRQELRVQFRALAALGHGSRGTSISGTHTTSASPSPLGLPLSGMTTTPSQQGLPSGAAPSPAAGVISPTPQQQPLQQQQRIPQSDPEISTSDEDEDDDDEDSNTNNSFASPLERGRSAGLGAARPRANSS